MFQTPSIPVFIHKIIIFNTKFISSNTGSINLNENLFLNTSIGMFSMKFIMFRTKIVVFTRTKQRWDVLPQRCIQHVLQSPSF